MDINEFCRKLNEQHRKIIAQVEHETGQKIPKHLKKEYSPEEALQVLQLVSTLPPNHFLFDDTEFETARELYKMSAE